MAKNLVIVESPAKAKTIEGFLGKEFIVKSCFGHIRDLAKGNDAIDIKNGFEPHYQVTEDKEQVVKDLKKFAQMADMVWLASDEDREGEAISWHLYEALDLQPLKTKRIVFHEITKTAILKAIENPRSIDYNLVNAQQARRVLDRLVGFELSPVLWKKVKPSLSAGRVQSVAVRLIVEREREVKNFESSFTFKVTGDFSTQAEPNRIFDAELLKKFEQEAAAEDFLKRCIGASFTVGKVEVKPAKKTPSAPFTTSTLQQEASRKLGFSIAQTMMVAQKLYENGFITYMRTDSVNLSEQALDNSKNEILKNFGDRYLQRRTYTTKSAGAQEAHEAIRPTEFGRKTVDMDNNAKRLYDLIWKRTIASQMADAQLERTTATIDISTVPEKMSATGEVLKFDGFLKVYMESTDDEPEPGEGDAKMLPALKGGDVLTMHRLLAAQRFAKPPARYTEASLVKKLEELGIGRPSTYAPTISTIQKREYVVKEDREGMKRDVSYITLQNGVISKEKKTENYGAEKSKLFPTDIGMLVTDFLLKHFENIMDYHFTASVEKQFDEIAQGQQEWNKMIEKFYGPFHETVTKTADTADRSSGERTLGADPTTGKPVLARLGRYGAMVQIGAADDPDKKFASLRPGQSIEDISLDQALDLFKLPRVVGEFEDSAIKVAIGRFGPYIAHGGKFVSLHKTDDPYTITEERAVELILAKRQSDIDKTIKVFPSNPDVKILKGRWGPFIAIGKENVKMPKDVNPESLTLEDCLELARKEGKLKEPQPEKVKAVKVKKATTAKSATAPKKGAKPKTKAVEPTEPARPRFTIRKKAK
ncbi:MAG TPA: type I DNA topoisomerase [Patescibacteria group bacterium]|nr:type I DNA topoisomerase [Patescibacteria group bacterium]